MSISSNGYLQLRDYLTQLTSLSGKGSLPKITQTLIGKHLSVTASGVSQFLSGKTASPKKMMKNFVTTYPLEFEKWPKEMTSLCRKLQESDAWYFLIKQKPAFVPIPLTTHPQLTQAYPAFTLAPAFVALPQQTQKFSIPMRIPAPIIAPIDSCCRRRMLTTQAPVLPATRFRLQSRLIQAPLAISYRGHDTAKDAQGMLFDHMRFQTITKFPTRTLVPEDDIPRMKIEGLFVDALKQHPAALPYGEMNRDVVTCPPFVKSCAELGLLIIPGRVHKLEDEPIRLKHEYQILRKALNRGQPILGICAGSWRIWEQLIVWTKFSNSLSTDPNELAKRHKEIHTLIPVKDHCSSKMIQLQKQGIKAVYNIQIHDVLIEADSLVATALRDKNYRMTVNSVHWKAVNPKEPPVNIKVSGIAVNNPLIQVKSRQGSVMNPQENAVEAFENVFGAPIMGIQWHPEGYDEVSSQGNLLKYMALAGSAYAAKRKMLGQLQKTRIRSA